MAGILLEHDADVEGLDDEDNTPLVNCSAIDIAKLLLIHNADADAHKTGQTVLNTATKRRRSDMITLLIKEGATTWSLDSEADRFIENLLKKHLQRKTGVLSDVFLIKT
ncbi:hypothetical protein BU25DRAFT_480604 [Macroventuria anomochaeta]|uniref:Uncharacterized protein n=1 Tax=Macroventuria anomochaeta TaxID=301207 RepID=A0ACB6RKM7_9PLEO|nr:uncharacterized protein BU25DRAFT_480604 [Macroventuria anomochaeta]KAF2622324.1 hypothetical protein BU25DRAFT_480604 [Macroventuria anomochaeta]